MAPRFVLALPLLTVVFGVAVIGAAITTVQQINWPLRHILEFVVPHSFGG
jgi:hypothetical protein